MKNTIKTLKLFIDNKEERFTIKRAAEKLNMNYRIAHEEIQRLNKENSIKITKIGNSSVCEFNFNFNNKTLEIEELRKKEILKNKDLNLIYKRITEIKNPFYILLLFGSFVSKKNNKNSDIDLCLITNLQEISKKIREVVEITPLPIDLQEFSSDQFVSMITSKENNVGNEILKNYIILHGIESFYEVVTSVR